ncbi:MAG: hypothetical protein U1E27_12580 [Kiritimatiellia bacterium]|nr:hypothetical protein [Kiritimatiellia bacterium]
MHVLDWGIVSIAILIVVFIGVRTQQYMRGVADFLTAGRVAGRYVLCVAGAEAGMGLISLVAMFESYYNSGFAFNFWSSFAAPISIVLGLTGYCVYRFRETRAMTMGQFLEIRYSRRFRLFAGILQATSGILNYALFPAVGARFLVYFCGLPVQLNIFGWIFPTFALLMALFLALAVMIATKGGQITIMVTDCVQGLLSYPMYLIVVAYILTQMSWFKDMAPAILDRPPGKSLINPFDIKELRDFNLFYVIVGIVGSIVGRMGWSGAQGYSVAARNAHEQKMGGVLGTWRAGFSVMMYVLLAIFAFTYLNSDRFQQGDQGAQNCRTELAVKAAEDVIARGEMAETRQEVIQYLRSGVLSAEMTRLLDRTAAIRTEEAAGRERIRYVGKAETSPKTVVEVNESEARQSAREFRTRTAQDAIYAVDPGAAQTFGTITGQMRVPMALRYLLPVGVMGLFCAICIFLMISTDTTYLHSWGSIVVQDVILPLRRRPFTPVQQIRLLRWMIASVAVFAFFFSYLFGQVDYILMFFAITGAIWLGGSGPCIVGGLYWKRGTTAGAWAALTSGSTLAVAAIVVQKLWASRIYPWLHARDLVRTVAIGLERASAPFEPIIKWRMSSEKFPINSTEVYALTLLISILLYIVVSLLTSRGGRVFNMDRMLHRGKYHREGLKVEFPKLTWRTVFPRLIGIDSQYTRGDRILARSVFIWSFGWGFVVSFGVVAIWNLIRPWSNQGWTLWFFIQNIAIAGAIGIVSTIWFTIGGTMDLRRLFRDLARREVNDLDDGRVVGHVSADDLALIEQVEGRAPAVPEPSTESGKTGPEKRSQ